MTLPGVAKPAKVEPLEVPKPKTDPSPVPVPDPIPEKVPA